MKHIRCAWDHTNNLLVETITTTVPSQLPRSLGVAMGTEPQLFFLDGTKVQQVRFSNNQWKTIVLPSTLDASIPNGPMGVVAWADSPHLFDSVSGGRDITQVAWNGHWIIGDMEADGYE